MKKVKILAVAVLLCGMGKVGYSTYKSMAMSEAEKFMQTNVEALTRDESGGGTKYTCESKFAEGDRLTRFCGTCTEIPNSVPSWDSWTKECTI